ncbi:MAG: DUF2889 domain-containing protein [Castellaniella sp.]|uniref:DUF2889 domain-containing protein n=1 Tax=Castellaniella sp. TaxID=1955812 RepID=UPI003C742164
MPLSDPACPRRPVHTRSIRVDSYARDDGLWDLEAELVDTKTYDFPVRGGGVHPAGAPVHHMCLRITIDDQFTITAAEAAYEAAPYGEFCSAIAPEYGDLVGLNLLKQFRQRVRERFGRTAGCTHVTELTNVLPTVAVQTMADRRRKADTGDRPFQLDGCHALRLDGPVVRMHYSPWYVPAEASETEAKSDES